VKVSSIELRIYSKIPTEDINEILLESDSGLKLNNNSESYDFHKPLQSTTIEFIAFAGIVLNIAQLAITIYKLSRKSKDAKAKKRENNRPIIQVLIQNRTISFSTESPKEIEDTLKKELSEND
jgi:hypothetical protein